MIKMNDAAKALADRMAIARQLRHQAVVRTIRTELIGIVLHQMRATDSDAEGKSHI
jgi:hypothetical protein